MFKKVAVENIEKGDLIITSGEYKEPNWTNVKLRGLEIVSEPVFLEERKRALITCRDDNGKIIDGCLKIINDNEWDIVLLVTPYDVAHDKPTDFSGEIIVPAIIQNLSANELIAGSLLKKQIITTLAEFKKHNAVVIANDTFGAMVIRFTDQTECINVSRGDSTQVMDLKLHTEPGTIANWRVMKHENDAVPVIFPANDSEFGIQELTFRVVGLVDL